MIRVCQQHLNSSPLVRFIHLLRFTNHLDRVDTATGWRQKRFALFNTDQRLLEASSWMYLIIVEKDSSIIKVKHIYLLASFYSVLCVRT